VEDAEGRGVREEVAVASGNGEIELEAVELGLTVSLPDAREDKVMVMAEVVESELSNDALAAVEKDGLSVAEVEAVKERLVAGL
jgi:hypothetical protein